MKPGSAIINTGSVTGIDGSKDLVDYSMTKGGIHAFTRALVGQPAAARHPGELRGAGAGLDAAQPVGQGAGEGRALRGEDADEAAGAARGDRARPTCSSPRRSARATSPARSCRSSAATEGSGAPWRSRPTGRSATSRRRPSRPAATGAAQGDAFVVQKHAARRLHYDLRLEIGDTLASWAVTKGPSLVPGEKRLAVRVEDHPLDYADFEGAIPKGQYGGGEVIVWDRGRWAPEGDPARGLKKGRLDFTLEGAKLKGRWHLVRMGARRGEKRENWLLIKGGDEAARTADDPDILDEAPASVISGRTVEDIAAGRPAPREGGRRRPGRARRLAGVRAAGAGDAEAGPAARRRLGARDQVRRLPAGGAGPERQGEAPDPRRPGLDRALRGRSPRRWRRCRRGRRSSTASWWSRAAGGRVGLLRRCRPTSRRDAATASATTSSTCSTSTAATCGSGRSSSARRRSRRCSTGAGGSAAAQRALRGGRRGDAQARLPAQPRGAGVEAARRRLSGRAQPRRGSSRNARRGRSSSSPATCPRRSSRDLVGSLVLGVYRDGELVHVGRVGTGFGRAVAADLVARLRRIERKTPPFAEKLDAAARRGVIWVKPELVAEVEFRAWTAEGILRHAAFRGLREDKPAREVVREEAGGGEAAPARPRVRLTHPDRVYWPDVGRHQAGARRLLRRGLAADGAVRRQPAGGAAALPGRHARGSASSRSMPGRGRAKEILTFDDPEDDSDAPLARGRRAARADRAGAGRRARDPHLAVDARRPRASRPDRRRPRSGGGGGVAGGDRGGRGGAGAAGGRRGSRPS